MSSQRLSLRVPPQLAGRGWLLAYSGGLDSTVLLHLLLASSPSRLRAIHVHHGLQGCADDWAQHCQASCQALGVPIEVIRVQVREGGQGPEAAARDARYAALRGRMDAGEVLVTAHHQDDQAETVLLRLVRGSGVPGLAGMHGLSEFSPGWLWRPLIDASRAQVRAEASTRGLHGVEDAHNRDLRYARSYLRAELLPRLAERWPAVSSNLARAALLQREAGELLQELAATDLATLRSAPDLPAQALPTAGLLTLSAPRRRNLLRHWIAALGLPAPFHDSLHRLDAEVLAADPDAEPVLAWPGVELRRYRDRLYAMPPLPPAPEDFRLEWDGCGRLQLPPGCGSLQGIEPVLHAGQGGFTVRLPIPLGRYRPAGSEHSRKLRTLFQERGVPPWVRVRTPALERDGEVVWIGGIGAAVGMVAGRVEWRDRPPGAAPG
ncbi:MAG: tRNA lysidine(34) synthetase TilS [Panacagrimonas sp.]